MIIVLGSLSVNFLCLHIQKNFSETKALNLEIFPEEKNIDEVSEDNLLNKVNLIRNWYENDVNNIKNSNYKDITDDENLKAYFNENHIMVISVPKNYNSIKYSRMYFLRNDRLYFAFIFSGRDENRLYFNDGVLIRYIDKNGSCFEDEKGLSECPFLQMAIEESESLQKHFIKMIK